MLKSGKGSAQGSQPNIEQVIKIPMRVLRELINYCGEVKKSSRKNDQPSPRN
jgi:hypothetical protein